MLKVEQVVTNLFGCGDRCGGVRDWHQTEKAELVFPRNRVPPKRVGITPEWNFASRTTSLAPFRTSIKSPSVAAASYSASSARDEKQLLEDHVIEGVTLERLGREQRLDRRTIRRRIKRAIQRLREAEKDLP